MNTYLSQRKYVNIFQRAKEIAEFGHSRSYNLD